MDAVSPNSTCKLVQTSITNFFSMRKNNPELETNSKQSRLSLKKSSQSALIDLTIDSDGSENGENKDVLNYITPRKKRRIGSNVVTLKHNYQEILSSDEDDNKNEQVKPEPDKIKLEQQSIVQSVSDTSINNIKSAKTEENVSFVDDQANNQSEQIIESKVGVTNSPANTRQCQEKTTERAKTKEPELGVIKPDTSSEEYQEVILVDEDDSQKDQCTEGTKHELGAVKPATVSLSSDEDDNRNEQIKPDPDKKKLEQQTTVKSVSGTSINNIKSAKTEENVSFVDNKEKNQTVQIIESKIGGIKSAADPRQCQEIILVDEEDSQKEQITERTKPTEPEPGVVKSSASSEEYQEVILVDEEDSQKEQTTERTKPTEPEPGVVKSSTSSEEYQEVILVDEDDSQKEQSTKGKNQPISVDGDNNQNEQIAESAKHEMRVVKPASDVVKTEKENIGENTSNNSVSNDIKEENDEVEDSLEGLNSRKRRVSDYNGENVDEGTAAFMEMYANKGFTDEDVNIGKISVRQDLYDDLLATHSSMLEPEVSITEGNDSVDAHVGFMKTILNYVFKPKSYQHLFSAEQVTMYQNLMSLDFVEFKFCVRLFYRKNGWHRLSVLMSDTRLNLDFDTINIEAVVTKLAGYNILDTDTTTEDIRVLLNLLNIQELKDVAKKFKLPQTTNKESIIERLLQNSRNQKTISFIKSPSLLDILSKTVRDKLGICIRVNENFRNLLRRCHLLYAITEHGTPQDIHRLMWENIAQKHCQKIDTLQVFENEQEFSEYEKYRFLYEELLLAIESKNRVSALTIVFATYEKFLEIVDDEQYLKKVSEIPSFLKKFTVGNCVVNIVSSGITLLKQELKNKKNMNGSTLLLNSYYQKYFNSENLEYDHVCRILDNLLKQNLYKPHKKWEWLKEKIIILKQYKKDFSAACQVLIPYLSNKQHLEDELMKFYLSTEINSFINSKKVTEDERKVLQVLQPQVSVTDNFSKKVIHATEVPDTRSGRKTIYKTLDVDGKSYNTVEEIAINYYKENEDFEEGIHAEGAPLYILFKILFWDIIYEHYVPFTFVSPLQKRPLDLYSKTFYSNRQTWIDERLEQLKNCSYEEIEQMIVQRVQSETSQSGSVLNSVYCDINLLKVIVKCISRDVLVNIFELLVKNFGTYKAGFPDLFLWNVEQRKYKFVEVKGRRDKLRPKQILWLRYLQQIGGEAEICEVNTNRKYKNEDSDSSSS